MNSGKPCVSVCAGTADEMIAQITRAEEFADVIEVRFDCLASTLEIDKLFTWIKASGDRAPLIATFRSSVQGGKRSATREERQEFWRRDFSQFEFCDAEGDIVGDVEVACGRIGSFHDFDSVPEGVVDHFRTLGETADVVKIAATVDDAADALPLWGLLRENKPAIPIAMGEAGKWTRILGLAHGAFLTYASLDEGKETADGQITAKEMIEVFRVKDLDHDTKVYGIIGNPVSQSMSPYFQNPAFQAAGLNSVFMPLLVKDLKEFIRRMVKPATREVELSFSGFSVTMPHKLAIMQHLDEIDPVAKGVGAVNTVVVDDGKLIGHNTDVHGFITPLKREFGDLKGAKVSIGGAGGAARACVYALSQEGADVTVYARDANKAAGLAAEFGAKVGIPHRSFEPGTVDILVNATPLGMSGGETEATIATAAQLKGVRLVYDLVYNPTETRLMREAKAAGVPAIGGLEMLVTQGARQFELWTGVEPPIDVMKKALQKRMSEITK